jgi:hypothetical protein
MSPRDYYPKPLETVRLGRDSVLEEMLQNAKDKLNANKRPPVKPLLTRITSSIITSLFFRHNEEN